MDSGWPFHLFTRDIPDHEILPDAVHAPEAKDEGEALVGVAGVRRRCGCHEAPLDEEGLLVDVLDDFACALVSVGESRREAQRELFELTDHGRHVDALAGGPSTVHRDAGCVGCAPVGQEHRVAARAGLACGVAARGAAHLRGRPPVAFRIGGLVELIPVPCDHGSCGVAAGKRIFGLLAALIDADEGACGHGEHVEAARALGHEVTRS